MNQKTSSTTEYSEADEVNFGHVLLPILAVKKWLVIAALGILGISIGYVSTIPSTYESAIHLIPAESGTKNDALGGAAALLGKRSSSGGDPDLYRSLLTSRMVMKWLIRTTVRDDSDTGNGRSVVLAKLIGIDTSNHLSAYEGAENLASSIKVVVKEAGIVEVTASTRSPWLSKQVVENVVSIGQELIIKIQADRFSASIHKMQNAAAQARIEWDSAAREVSRYKDYNRAISLPAQQLQLDRLLLEKEAKEQKYLLVKRELEQTLVDKMKALPPMMVLDEAELPIKPSGPKRLRKALLIFGSSFMALCMLIVLADWLKRWKRP